MQRSKNTNKISDTRHFFKNPDTIFFVFSSLLKEFKLTRMNTLLSSAKSKGINPKTVFQTLFILPFINADNIHKLMGMGISKDIVHKKDVFYEFMKNERIDWRRILTLFVSQFNSITARHSEDRQPDSPICLIVDDSILTKSGKCIELIGKVYDHCTHTYQLGMKMLVLGLWDGKSFLPVDYSLHNEPGKNQSRGLKKKQLQAQFTKVRACDSPGHKRVQEVEMGKIESALAMIKRAVRKIESVQYVLADSWFITADFISEIQNISPRKGRQINVIGLMKSNRIYTHGNSKIKGDTISELKRSEIKYCQKFKCYYIPLQVNYKGIEIKLFCIRMRGQQSWKTLITTDLKLSFINTMKYYQIRWSIEVFFKDCKQNLRLNKCQSTDFDAYIASITICFMTYMVLSLRKRFDDYESLGKLFSSLKEFFLEATIIEKIWNFIIEFFNSIFSELGVDLAAFMNLLIDNQEKVIGLIRSEIGNLFSINRKLV